MERGSRARRATAAATRTEGGADAPPTTSAVFCPFPDQACPEATTPHPARRSADAPWRGGKGLSPVTTSGFQHGCPGQAGAQPASTAPQEPVGHSCKHGARPPAPTQLRLRFCNSLTVGLREILHRSHSLPPAPHTRKLGRNRAKRTSFPRSSPQHQDRRLVMSDERGAPAAARGIDIVATIESRRKIRQQRERDLQAYNGFGFRVMVRGGRGRRGRGPTMRAHSPTLPSPPRPPSPPPRAHCRSLARRPSFGPTSSCTPSSPCSQPTRCGTASFACVASAPPLHPARKRAARACQLQVPRPDPHLPPLRLRADQAAVDPQPPG